MKDFNEHIDLIERYLYDDLSQEELEELNVKLKSDTEFNKLFHEMDNLLEGIRRSAKQTTVEEKLAKLEEALPYKMSVSRKEQSPNLFRQIIESLNKFVDRLIARLFRLDHEEMVAIPINSRGESSALSLAGRIKLVAASSIVILFIGAIFIYIQLSQLSPLELYSENFKPEIDVIVERTVEKETYDNLSPQEILDLANLEFRESNFGEAINLIESISDEHKLPGMKYCGALSYMKIENFERAKELLIQLGEVNDIVWQERSKWYLALCYLHENNTELAVEYLKDISEIGGENQEKAMQLLKKVNK